MQIWKGLSGNTSNRECADVPFNEKRRKRISKHVYINRTLSALNNLCAKVVSKDFDSCAWRARMTLSLFFFFFASWNARACLEKRERSRRSVQKCSSLDKSRCSQEDKMMLLRSINSRLWISIFVQDPRIFIAVNGRTMRAFCDTFLTMERKRIVEMRANN